MRADPRIYLEGYLDIPPEKLDAVKAAMPLHIDLTRQEPGCITFDLQFSSNDTLRLVVKEIFSDKAAFAQHQTRTQNSYWFKVTQGIARHYQIVEGGNSSGKPL